MADIMYHPVIGDSSARMAAFGPGRLLVIGDSLADGFEHAGDVRIGYPTTQLPSGIYEFISSEGGDALVVLAGAPSLAPDTAHWGDDDHWLLRCWDWFMTWWEDAAQVPPPLFSAGDTVLTRTGGQEATVRSRDFDRGAWSYRIRLDGRTVTAREQDLAPPEIDDEPTDWVMRAAEPADRFTATLTRAKLTEQLTDTVYSFRSTRTIFRPYQFRPVIRLLTSGSLRLLIADEVGLGKTIEAGLVWTELDARKQANRVLVVCPSMLVPKWRAEMRERFGYELDELERSDLDEFLDQVEHDRLPRRRQWICSLERLRVWDGLERLGEISPQLDLVIVDEAHAFRNSGTRSNALGALLSDWSDALIFLSATPLNLRNEDLYNLLELLTPGEFDDVHVLKERLQPNAVLNRVSASLLDRSVGNPERLEWLEGIRGYTFGSAVMARPEYSELVELLRRPELRHGDIALAKRLIGQLHALSAVVTRTRKVEVQEHKSLRRAQPIEVRWTPPERALYDAIDRWQRTRAKKKGLPVGFVTQMPLRLASTCLPAARQQILDRHPVAWGDLDVDPPDPATGIGGWDPEDDPPPEVVAAAEAIGDVDSKYDEFRAALDRVVGGGRRVLVFTFARPALAYLEERLTDDGFSVGVLHGDVPRDQRLRLMQRFRDNQFQVLLASRVASEGLDFEFASAIVNYDLPWNPMEVEQRIGRIDRFGQEADVLLILNFHTPGTIETDIIERVHERIGVFENSIGELEPIVQSTLDDLRRVMFDPELSPAERQRRLDEQLTAIEALRHAEQEVESASAFLTAADDAEIAGLEDDLVRTGRYVGQPELVRLLHDWVLNAPGARLKEDADGMWVHLRGTAHLEKHLQGVLAAGERSQRELEHLAQMLRDETEISLCLDQEHARTTGADLLGANHPLVRAALRVPGAHQARFASVRSRSKDAPPGQYLVLVSLARWNGLRPSSEFWTSAVHLDGSPAGSEPGDALLAALATGELTPGATPEERYDLANLVGRTLRIVTRRQADEVERRIAENEAMVETRRISLRETHDRKVRQILSRIQTLRERNSLDVIRLHEAQLANQDRLLAEAEANLRNASHGDLLVEHVAVCLMEVAG